MISYHEGFREILNFLVSTSLPYIFSFVIIMFTACLLAGRTTPFFAGFLLRAMPHEFGKPWIVLWLLFITLITYKGYKGFIFREVIRIVFHLIQELQRKFKLRYISISSKDMGLNFYLYSKEENGDKQHPVPPKIMKNSTNESKTRDSRDDD